MKEKPILFSPAMARAVLSGKKTQTRRVVRGAWHEPEGYLQSEPEGEDLETDKSDKGDTTKREWYFSCRGVPASHIATCPYGEVGDRLWVREEHYIFGHWEMVEGLRTKTDKDKWRFVPDSKQVQYEPPENFRTSRLRSNSENSAWHKRLARFMPRWASRMTLEIDSVRVERLHDISEDDALSEGATTIRPEGEGGDELPSRLFERLWTSINGRDSWDLNPWVWVVQFRRVIS